MRVWRRFQRGELKLNRIEAFSDGVFAIVVTLLVLDLKVPAITQHTSAAELGHALLSQLPNLVSWLISFIIVCKFWLNHHHILALASHADYAMVWLNSLFLMFQSFVPFPTAVMGTYPDNALAVSAFGATMALNTLLFIALHAYILKNLAKPALAAIEAPGIIAKSFAGVVAYGVGAGLAWWHIEIGFVVYALTPLLFIVPPAPKA